MNSSKLSQITFEEHYGIFLNNQGFYGFSAFENLKRKCEKYNINSPQGKSNIIMKMSGATLEVCFANPKKVPNKKQEHLRILSWDVNYWENEEGETNLNDVVNVVESINPDILLLQKAKWGKRIKTPNGYVLFNIAKHFKDIGFRNATSQPTVSMGGNCSVRGNPFGVLILSKLPLRRSPPKLFCYGNEGNEQLNALLQDVKHKGHELTFCSGIVPKGTPGKILDRFITRNESIDVLGISGEPDLEFLNLTQVSPNLFLSKRLKCQKIILPDSKISKAQPTLVDMIGKNKVKIAETKKEIEEESEDVEVELCTN